MANRKKTEIHSDLSIKHFIKHLTKESLHIDKRIKETLGALLFKPGQLTKTYFSDNKDQYIHPFRFYLAINFIFFFLTPMMSTPKFQVFSYSMKSLGEASSFHQNILDNTISSSGISQEIFSERFNAHLKYNQSAYVIIVIPVMALLMKLIYIGRKRFFMEHVIYAIHYLTFFLFIILFSLVAYRLFSPLSLLIPIPNFMIIGIVSLLFILMYPLYFYISTKKYYQNRTGISMLSSVLSCGAFLISMGFYTQFLFFYTVLSMRLGY